VNFVERDAIFGPFFAMMLLTLIVWVYMYIRRISFIRQNELQPEQLAKPGELARLSPAAVSNPSDNLKNLFEMPVLFYAMVLFLYITDTVDPLYMFAAWLFVLFRTLHSAVHCTINIVTLRFSLYFISTAALWFLVVRAALAHFAGP
jgi:hypothetical protein